MFLNTAQDQLTLHAYKFKDYHVETKYIMAILIYLYINIIQAIFGQLK